MEAMEEAEIITCCVRIVRYKRKLNPKIYELLNDVDVDEIVCITLHCILDYGRCAASSYLLFNNYAYFKLKTIINISCKVKKVLIYSRVALLWEY